MSAVKLKDKKIKKLFLSFFAALMLTSFSFFIYTLLTGKISFSELEDGWDGTTVATSFSAGNGTKENPYVIKTPEEFVYFKTLIEGENYLSYQDKYYVLENDIDMNQKSLSGIGTIQGEQERIFKGHFDGKHHKISNLLMDSPIQGKNYSYYALFTKLEDAEVKNLFLYSYKIFVKEDQEKIKVGLLGEVFHSKIHDISIHSFDMNYQKLNSSDVSISILANSVSKDSIIQNIYIDGKITGEIKDSFGMISEENLGNVSYIISNLNLKEELIDSTIQNQYFMSNGKIYEKDQEENIESILLSLNETIDSKYYWEMVENRLVLQEYMKKEDTSTPSVIPRAFSFSMAKAAPSISLHASGTDGDTIYVNDLDSDWNHYQGRNYTESNGNSYPNIEKINKYHSSSLAKVYIAYRGEEIDENSNLKGYVSLNERYSNIIYYKYYPIEDGYVTIPLIDNPYADRPTNRAFNGWVTDYENAVVSLDVDTYTRYVKVPAQEEISITMYASWTEATVANSINDSNLKNAGMQSIATVTYVYNVPTLYSRNSITSGYWSASYYPSGAVNEYGNSLANSTCPRRQTCTYYMQVNPNSLQQGQSLYRLYNGYMTSYTVPAPTPVYHSFLNVGANVSGYFEKVRVTGSLNGYYNASGVLQTGGTCNGGNNCDYYRLLPYSSSHTLTAENYDKYYYLVTRDTNIVVLSSSISGFINNKPMTVTGIHNGTNYSSNYIDISSYSISANADLRIEHCLLYSGVYSGQTNGPAFENSRSVFGNFYNLKLGRGITAYSDYFSARSVVAGSNYTTGSATSPTQYSLIVESGYYNYISGYGTTNISGSSFVDFNAIYGSDIDRVQSNGNNNLDVYYNVASTYGGNVSSGSLSKPFGTTTIKSGTFGSETSDPASGVYAGGLIGGKIQAPVHLFVEGGKILNLNGGPLVDSNLSTNNVVYIHFKGGEADFIFGGAAVSETYGNRIINATGGTIHYAVFGGSNGVNGNNSNQSKGTLSGKTFIHVGGNTVIGDITATKFGVQSGSVFGSGNGNSNYSTIGSVYESRIVIDGNPTIHKNVYGAGNYGPIGTTTDTGSSTISIQNGTIKGSVFGGSRTKGIVYGNANVSIHGGTIQTDVYGGGEGGYRNTNNPGTYVRDNVNVNIHHGTIQGSIYGGSAYGTVNALNQTTNTSSSKTNVTISGGVIQNSVFGGGKGGSLDGISYTPKVIGDITVTINGGNIGKVFGGFDASGSPSQNDIVYLNGGTIGNAFGGGNNTGQAKTDIRLQGSTITANLFGGSNESGNVTESNVTVTSGSVGEIYGANNLNGTTSTSKVNVSGATITGDIYGGGFEAGSGTSHVNVVNYHNANTKVFGGGKKAGMTGTNVTTNQCTLSSVFGGSNVSGNVSTTNVKILASEITSVYGGNNQGGSTATASVESSSATITNLFGGGDNASSTTSYVKVNSGNITNIYGGGNEAGLTTSNISILGGNIGNIFGGSNRSGNVSTSRIQVGDTSLTSLPNITNLYGGNNLGGTTGQTNIRALSGNIHTLYGGGNEAVVNSTHVLAENITAYDIYGGGNAAGVTTNTLLDIVDSTVSHNIYGGGNEGIVQGNTEVTLTNASIQGNAFGGGNGSTAIVHKNTTITIDGNTIIGTPTTIAPADGCVFGGGNAANTGLSTTNNSKSTVNLVGGKIYGNVYGGPKMAVVYGSTDTNIGTSAVSKNGLIEDNIHIVGTVFGGGESNASGSDTYDWTFISVTKGIDVNIDGTGYDTHNHNFMIQGSIFGSGNASTSSGLSNISIKNLGSRDKPNKSISIQRTNQLEINQSVIELEGTTDRTNEYSDILYSLNIIDKMILKNGSVLLLQHNANMLKELYSGVDSSGSLVPATVSIDEDSQTVTRNVDNRIYMLPGQNLNVTINQSATAYGKITGMTFFGMYVGYDSGTYRYGLYDDDINYGDQGNVGLEIAGGSYVVGLRNVNHDITKDGFYSNYLEEDYTSISVRYINPTPIGETGYRWIIGFDAINYEFTLNASKYSSLGTHELQLIDFAEGNTTFHIVGFDASGLSSEIQLVDSNNVPRIGRTLAIANNTFGLSMKAETQEWTSHSVTKMLGDSSLLGESLYQTDNRKLAPSLMFYLYHAKNIDREGKLGTVVLTVRAEIPKNAIDYDVRFITITINLVAKKYDDADSYDASITYSKRYEMPSSTLVNITNQSQFTAYFSLTLWKDNFSDIYGNNNTNYHVLTTNSPLPVGTMITMLDYAANENRPEYYYFVVTEDVYQDSLLQLSQHSEIIYPLHNFIKMGSTSSNNTYQDASSNLLYYNSETGLVDEEFIFIFDFKETNTTGEHLNNTMLFELRTQENRTLFSVLGIRERLMVYNTYDSSNIVLQQTIQNTDQYLYYNIADDFTYSTLIQYNQTENRQPVIDTNYESSSMGINVSFYNREGVPVSSSMLLGTSITINQREYFADRDGIFRIKLANKVSNLTRLPKLTVHKDLPVGEYTIKYTLFASDDGLHNSVYENSVTEEFVVHVVSADNSITVDCEDEYKIVNGDTGLNQKGTTENIYRVRYNSELSNPNFRVEIFKREIDEVHSTTFTSVPFNTLFSNVLTRAHHNEEMYINMGDETDKFFTFRLKNSLTSGTYRVVFKLYDQNQFIDEEVKYVIVHKKTE